MERVTRSMSRSARTNQSSSASSASAASAASMSTTSNKRQMTSSSSTTKATKKKQKVAAAEKSVANQIVKELKPSVEETDEEVVGFVGGFKLPSEQQKLEALGFGREDIPTEFYPHKECFHDIPTPTHEDDWLAQHREARDPFTKWKAMYRKVNADKNVIYILPIGRFDKDAPSIDDLEEYVRIFYLGMRVERLPPLEFQEGKDGSLAIEYAKRSPERQVAKKSNEPRIMKRVMNVRRAHPYDLHKVKSTARQLAVDPLLNVCYDMKPSDAYCVLGITMEDLFEGSDDSFVVGMAAGGSHIGVFSFARYDPFFADRVFAQKHARIHNERHNKGRESYDRKIRDSVLLARSCKVMVHEIGHLFCIGHCVYYHCCMNGSGHLIEDFSQPMELCPIDLRKLHEATKCDVMKRWQLMVEYFAKHGMEDDRVWLQRRIDVVLVDKKT